MIYAFGSIGDLRGSSGHRLSCVLCRLSRGVCSILRLGGMGGGSLGRLLSVLCRTRRCICCIHRALYRLGRTRIGLRGVGCIPLSTPSSRLLKTLAYGIGAGANPQQSEHATVDGGKVVLGVFNELDEADSDYKSEDHELELRHAGVSVVLADQPLQINLVRSNLIEQDRCEKPKKRAG